MKVIIASVLFISLVFGDHDFHQTFSGDTLIQVTEVNSRPGKSYVRIIPRAEEYTIGPYAFNGTQISNISMNGREYPGYGHATNPTESSLSLQQDSFAGIPELQVLKLFYVKVNFNNQNPLAQLESLNELDFQFTYLTRVPSEVFTSVRRLQWLILKWNNISTIYSDSFSSLKILENLDLSYNGISDIEPGAFHGLTELKNLNLAHNNITIFPDIFKGTPKLINLNLEKAFNRNVTQLQPGMFDDLGNLTDLSLNKNNFESIPMGMFDHLESLENLDLSCNNIEKMTPFTYGRLWFDKLFFQENRINVIAINSFSGIDVNHLRLDHNRIQVVGQWAFDGLTTDRLDLSGNQLTEIGFADFAGCRASHLDLSSNKIESIAEGALTCVLKELRIDATVAEQVNNFDSGLQPDVRLILVQNQTLLYS